jgi:adenylate cyclase
MTAGLLGEDPTLRETLFRRSGGVPLFLEEMLRDLKETGSRDPDSGFGTPVTVRAVIAARIERLSPAARRTLQIASVIGVEVPEPLLAQLVGEDVDLEATLAGLLPVSWTPG